MTKISTIPRVTEVAVVAPFGLHLTFDDGTVRDIDLSGELWGPAFEALCDPSYFARVTVDHGTVMWPNGVDLDPIVLHGDRQPATRPIERRTG